jgi:hypothetical protein
LNPVVLYLLVGIASLVALTWAYNTVIVRVRAHRRRCFLREASADEIARDCARAVRFMGWADRAAGARLLEAKRAWTERELLDALDALYEEVTRGDTQRGYGSNYFFFYDGGFAETRSALCDRLGLPRP